MKNNNRFAHTLKKSNIENFYKIMSGEKKVITKKDESEFEASYFAMCLLIPKEFFLQMIEFLGGIEIVKSDSDRKECLARVFNVEYKLIEARISDLLSQETEQSKSKLLKNKFQNRNK